jgi:hypothetical protein
VTLIQKQIIQKMEKQATNHLGYLGAMISGSKSSYVKHNPNNLAIFNSNVIALIDKPTKIWFGDIDITKSIKNIQALAKELGVSLVVLREMDGRFNNEESPKVDRFVIKVNPDESFELGEFESTYYSNQTLEKL